MNRKLVARAPASRAWLLSAVIGCLLGAVPGLVISDDFDYDGDWDVDDIDLLVGEIINGTNHSDFDLTDDNFVNIDDLTEWLEIGGIGNGYGAPYLVGDTDLSSCVDGIDMNNVASNIGSSTNTWSGGDLNADGVVDSEDLDLVTGNYETCIYPTLPGEIGWEPLTMDFGVLVVGDSADQTLTLTNTADDGTLIISNIRFTFNQSGAFSMTPFDSAFLSHGDSTVLGFTFVPPDFSFFMADIRILSNASNASSLIYNMIGMGDFTVVCPPPNADCGGICVDLSNDVNNCGSCGNICNIPLHATAFCDAGSCDYVCDPGYIVDGDGCSPIGGPIEFDIVVPSAIHGAGRGYTPVKLPVESHLLESVVCGPGMATAVRINPDDIDGDGIEDEATALVYTDDLSLDCSTSTIICEGVLTDGTPFVGTSNPITVVRAASGKACRL